MKEEKQKNRLTIRADRLSKLTWVLLVLQVIGTGILMKFLPDRVPMHFNAMGEIDRYGSKYELVVLVVLTILVVFVFKGKTTDYKESGDESADSHAAATARTNRYTMTLTGLTVEIVMIAVEVSLAISSLKGYEGADETAYINTFIMFLYILVGVILILFGNVMPKSRNNGVFGVRTSWSRYNDKTWAESNRLGGKISIATGALCIIIACITGPLVSSVAVLSLVVIMAVVMVVVSYKVYLKVKAEEDSSAEK